MFYKKQSANWGVIAFSTSESVLSDISVLFILSLYLKGKSQHYRQFGRDNRDASIITAL